MPMSGRTGKRLSALAGILLGLWLAAGWAPPAAAGRHAVAHALQQGCNYGRPKVS